jgi:hypothetical protein
MIPSNPNEWAREVWCNRIVRAFIAADADAKLQGAVWYRMAHTLALELADGDVKVGAGVIAALSANKGWWQNQLLATDALTGFVHGHTGDVLDKVRAIMAGQEPETVLPMRLKTGHFYRCISNPSDPYSVVIDRHAHDIAIGQRLGDAARGLNAVNRYEALADAYRAAGEHLGKLPMNVQATVWVAHVNEGN